MEVTEDGVSGLVRECGGEVDSGRCEQVPAGALAAAIHFATCKNRLLTGILDEFGKRIDYFGVLVT